MSNSRTARLVHPDEARAADSLSLTDTAERGFFTPVDRAGSLCCPDSWYSPRFAAANSTPAKRDFLHLVAAVGGGDDEGDNASVHGVPKRFLDHPHCISAWVAGASVSDTPESKASFGLVFHAPSWESTQEEGQRLPREYIWYGDWPYAERPRTIYDERLRRSVTMGGTSEPPTTRAPFPGTLLAAEWLAVLAAIRLASRAQPQVHPDDLIPFEPPLDPIVLYTTRREIADVIDGRLTIADTPWLSRIQRTIAVDIRRSIQRRRGRDYFTEPQYGVGFDTFVSLIRPSENHPALRLAKDALGHAEFEGVLLLDNVVRSYDATHEWALRKAERR